MLYNPQGVIIFLLVLILCNMPEREMTIEDAEAECHDWAESNRPKTWKDTAATIFSFIVTMFLFVKILGYFGITL